jgi:hypothetical protein
MNSRWLGGVAHRIGIKGCGIFPIGAIRNPERPSPPLAQKKLWNAAIASHPGIAMFLL